MGMYTKLKVEIELDYEKKDILKVIEVLCFMLYTCGSTDDAPEAVKFFDDPLFETRRWHWMFRSSSAYFDEHEPSYLRDHVLYVDFDMKNYDNEIQKFLDWIRPYSRSIGEVGVYQYEENLQESKVVFLDNGNWQIERPKDVEGDEPQGFWGWYF